MPAFSPHDLRHRRVSLLHQQGRSWAEIAGFVGQRKLSLTADAYTHVLMCGEEIDYAEVLPSRETILVCLSMSSRRLGQTKPS